MSDDLARYDRQMLLPGFGADGQRRLLDSTALLLGCGALGSVAADMLARAGVGHLVIIDRDFIELSNLQRQVLFDEQDVADGLPKAEAAKRKLARINSQVRVTAIVDDINHRNIGQYAHGADILVDGLDNFETRYLANDYAVRECIPYIYGAAVGMTGMALPILPRAGGRAAWESAGDRSFATPCFRCLFEEPPPAGSSPTCDTVGVISSAVAIVANFQVAEALKILTGHFERVNRTLLNFDLWHNEMLQLHVSAGDTDCPCCWQRRFEYLDGKAGSSAATLCGRNAVQLAQKQAGDVDLAAIAKRVKGRGALRNNEFMLQLQVSERDKSYEITLFANGRAIVKGTGDAGVARGIYAKYIGA